MDVFFVFFWFWWRSRVMCSSIITLVSKAACRNAASLFLIETSGVWELTEWSLSHHCLSRPHYREALWPLFSPIIHARAPSPALWLCQRYPHHPQITSFRWNLKAVSLLPNIPSSYTYDPLRHPHRQKSLLCPSPSLMRAYPPSRMKDQEGTRLCGIVRRQAASSMPAGIQRSKRPDIMLMEAFCWFSHDFTPCCSSQLSDTVTGAEWGCMQFKQSRENSSSELLIVALSPHDPFG